MSTIAIVTAAGKGKRMGSSVKKPYVMLSGKPILAHAVLPFEQSKTINAIIIVTDRGDEDFCLKNIVERFKFKKVVKVVCGGKERQDSVMAGIMAADGGWDTVAVHDGARPFITKEAVEQVIKSAKRCGAATLAVPVKDTIKQVCSGFVKKTLPRNELWAIQTPQAFRFDMLKKAHLQAKKQGFIGTDDSILVERTGCKVAVVCGSYDNIKITTQEDLVIGEAIANRLRL